MGGAPRCGGGEQPSCSPPPAPPFPPAPRPPQLEFREADYSKFLSALDTDKDGEVDFVEYARALACLCTYCHSYFKDCRPEPPCPQ